MNTQQQSRPVITPAMREQAAKQPNTWLYVVDPIFTDPNAEVPPWGFIGGYRVDERGELTDDFSPNPNYRPSPVALRLPTPTNDVERALQLTTTGYAQGPTLLAALLDAELMLFSQPQGSGLVTVEHESGRRQLQVFTSDAYLPQTWTSWQKLTGRQIADHTLTGVDVQINPTSPVKARIPGEDLVKTAATSPQSQNGSRPTPAASPGTPPADATQPVASASVQEAGSDDAGEPVTSSEQSADAAPATDSRFRTRMLGSMLAAAAGDALGAPVSHLPLDEIRERCGESGVTEYDREQSGMFSTDMQVMLFALDGLVRAHATVRSWPTENPLPVQQLALQRWLHSRGVPWLEAAGPLADQHPEPGSWLLERPELSGDEAPGCAITAATRRFAASESPPPDLRSPDGVVRAGVVALWSEDLHEVFETASRDAALTCPHPGDHLAAGAAAAIVHGLLRGQPLDDAVRAARTVLVTFSGHDECDAALRSALELAENGAPSSRDLTDALGTGETGSQALAIAVAATAGASGIGQAVLIAVNHSGPSAATGTLCGVLSGALHGAAGLPGVWLRDLQYRDVIEELVRDALLEFSPKPPQDANWAHRYATVRNASGVEFPDVLEPITATDPGPSPATEPQESTADTEEQSAAATSGPDAVESTPDSANDSTSADPTEDSDSSALVRSTAEVEEATGTTDTGAAALGAVAVAGVAATAVTADEDDDAGRESPVAEAAPVSGVETAAGTEGAPEPEADETAIPDDAAATVEAQDASSEDEISDEEFRLITALRRFRDADADTSADRSQDLRKLLEEAFGPERATQLLGELTEDSAGRSAEAPDADATESETAVEPADETPSVSRDQRLTGAVLGGAVGDALGAPWMFTALHDIREDRPDGPRTYTEAFGRTGATTAITQQSLFVLDGLIRTALRSRTRETAAHAPSLVQFTLHHWLAAQGVPCPTPLPTGPLAAAIVEQGQRFPDETTLAALASQQSVPTLTAPPNEGDGPIATARGATVGFHAADVKHAVTSGAEIAVVTHGHSNGYLPAGALAGIVHGLDSGASVAESVAAVVEDLDNRDGSEATVQALRSALEATGDGPAAPESLASLGTGWTAPEALGIALAAALSHPEDFTAGVALAATHSGNSAATAAVCGAVLGAALGCDAVPEELTEALEVREVATQLATDFLRVDEVTADATPDWAKHYRA
ncbi:type VII secretion system-associated protein [Allosaccharopolyspora coralli]|uniref:Type VII secretion system-associated protein n=1 Tax=Allosaccharopolyspora coralli TaxID=2665642 RepID=A0A5Q3Q759_9PSEU|nr:type VII secretion system-associated protein [Allosaccharopolyspora coralli]QGK69266.1 type VII secretion system-associated protein [Allosaccharopolyspora coralli]